MIASTQENMAPLIELRGVTKVYGTGQAAMQALAGIDLRIDEGDFVAIMGHSGSGKSTCLNILGCLDSPTSGSYLFRGLEVSQLTRDQRARLRRFYLGFVFQGYNLLKRTSAIENVELPLIYRHVPARERRQAARRALASVGLEGWESHNPNELSGGQQQRVAIARAIVTGPSVLMADEPTGNLDSRSGEEVMAILQQLNREQGITVILVTHDPRIARHAQRIIHLFDGEIVREELVTERILAHNGEA